MSGLFSPPAGGGDVVRPEELLDHLLILRPIDFRAEFPTSFGATDAISTDVVDLSAVGPDGQPRVYHGCLFFNRALVSGLKSRIGEMVLGRMTQGLAKPGQSAPWVLSDATGDVQAVTAATAWIGAHPEFQGLAPPSPIRPAQSTQYTPPIAGAAPGTPNITTTVPAMTFNQVPAEAPVPATVGAAPAAPDMAGITPETLALIARMQATGQIPGANSH